MQIYQQNVKHVRNTLGCYPYAHCSKRSPETSTRKTEDSLRSVGRAVGYVVGCFFLADEEEKMMIYAYVYIYNVIHIYIYR